MIVHDHAGHAKILPSSWEDLGDAVMMHYPFHRVTNYPIKNRMKSVEFLN